MKLNPEVVEIPYGTERHKEVMNAIRQRYNMSRFYMSQRYVAWSKQEEKYRAYVNLTTNDRERKEITKHGKPQYVTLDVPYSYAMLLTAHTYWTSVFLSRNPILQYLGRTGQSQTQESAVEALIDYQMSAGGMVLPLYTWFMDAGKYGLGVLGNSWYEDYTTVTDIVEVPKSYFGIPVSGTKKIRQTRKYSKYKGNRVFNVRPQDFFPDPRVPIYRLQDGEFCGRMIEIGWNTVVKRQAEGWYYNVEELRKNLKVSHDWLRDRGSSQIQLPAAMDTLFYSGIMQDANPEPDKKKKAFIETFEITIELVPRDWKLGESTYPEKWCFTVGNNEVILCAMPQGAIHGKFEFFPLEYEIEGYGLSKRSMLEIVDPLNDSLSWLFNSHMYNVRKILNDQLIADPSRIVMKDLTDPAAGRIIRLKPEAYGTDPSLAVHQLQVMDVTQQNVGNMNVVTDIMQRVLGVTENVMGMVNAGGRKTATEVRTSSTFGINRLKTNCEYMSAMGFTPWAEVVLQNTQQRYDDSQRLRIAGKSSSVDPYINVDPDTIAGRFDFSAVDGTMPIDRFAQAQLWQQMAQALAKIPPVAAQMDWFKIMAQIGELTGLKNFDQFRINVVPDGQAAASAQAGNSVPVPEGALPGGGPAAGPGGGSPSGGPTLKAVA